VCVCACVGVCARVHALECGCERAHCSSVTIVSASIGMDGSSSPAVVRISSRSSCATRAGEDGRGRGEAKAKRPKRAETEGRLGGDASIVQAQARAEAAAPFHQTTASRSRCPAPRTRRGGTPHRRHAVKVRPTDRRGRLRAA
jgi:hypothetical protein